MADERVQEIVDLTRDLLESIAAGDWDTYEKLCDPALSCFEPEACGHLVHGMEFHRFYFENLSHRMAINTTITSPSVRFVGQDAAIICFVRLHQRMASDGTAGTRAFEETRVWKNKTVPGSTCIFTARNANNKLAV